MINLHLSHYQTKELLFLGEAESVTLDMAHGHVVIVLDGNSCRNLREVIEMLEQNTGLRFSRQSHTPFTTIILRLTPLSASNLILSVGTNLQP